MPPRSHAKPTCSGDVGANWWPGAWISRLEAPRFPPCCSWDKAASESNPPSCINGNKGVPGRFVKVGGHGCQCTTQQQRAVARFTWAPSGCELPPFDGTAFCAALGNRTLLFIGDSTIQQMSGAIMNLLSLEGAPCADRVTFELGDTLIGIKLGVMNRGRPWLDSVRATGASLVVMSAYYHVTSVEGFQKVLQTVHETYAREFADAPNAPMVLWSTSLGGAKSDAPLDRLPAEIPGFWDAQRAQRRIYNHDQLEAWDTLALAFWRNRSTVHPLDLRPVWLLPNSKGSDAVHFCMPGPFETVARILTAYLGAHKATRWKPGLTEAVSQPPPS